MSGCQMSIGVKCPWVSYVSVLNVHRCQMFGWQMSTGGKCSGGICPWVSNVLGWQISRRHRSGCQMSTGGRNLDGKSPRESPVRIKKSRVWNVQKSYVIQPIGASAWSAREAFINERICYLVQVLLETLIKLKVVRKASFDQNNAIGIHVVNLRPRTSRFFLYCKIQNGQSYESCASIYWWTGFWKPSNWHLSSMPWGLGSLECPGRKCFAQKMEIQIVWSMQDGKIHRSQWCRRSNVFDKIKNWLQWFIGWIHWLWMCRRRHEIPDLGLH